MKLKYNFVTNEIADKFVAVAVGDDLSKFNGFIKMDKTGSEIFNLLKEETTIDTVVAEMSKLYPDVEIAEVKETVEGFIAELKKSEVI